MEARAIVHDVLQPLAESCADVGVRVLVGTRKHDDGGVLVTTIGAIRNEIDLDHPEFVDLGDVTAYALATLQLTGDPRPDSPYVDDRVARPVAQRIAEVSVPNFLVAGLLAREHGLHDAAAVDPASIALPGDQDRVQVALMRYLARMDGIYGLSPSQLLLPLAYAETPGLSTTLWATAIDALVGTSVDESALRNFASSAAANFLIETSEGSASYRLFHQALNDTLVGGQHIAADQRILTYAFMEKGARFGWADASRYLLRSIPHHALAGDAIDAALTDLDFVLHADLTRLIPAAASALSAEARAVATVIRRTPHMIDENPAARLSAFTVTEVADELDAGFGALSTGAPYRAIWARVRLRSDFSTLTGHAGRVDAVCAVELGGRTLLASAGNDATVRLWDPTTGVQERELIGHAGRVNAVSVVVVNGRTLLASASDDATVRLWDPVTEAQERELEGHTDSVNAVCAFDVGGRTLLATAGNDATVRLWDRSLGRRNENWRVTPTQSMRCAHSM